MRSLAVFTCARSMPRSRARARTAGEARTCVLRRRLVLRRLRASTPSAAGRGSGSGAGLPRQRRRPEFPSPARASPRLRRRRAGARPRCRRPASAARSAPSVSITASTEPIGIWSPTSPASSTTLPATGDSISTVALSVIMSAICWSSAIVVADLDVPGDDLGLGNAFADVGQLEFVASHQSAITFSRARLHALRAGEIGPFVGVRVGRVPAGHALDRRFEMIEAALLDERDQLGAEAAGARRLVDDEAAAGLLRPISRSSRCRAGRGCAGR